MTKEEAIKYLKQLYPNGGHCWLDEQRIEAIGMAVKALQEEPVSGELKKCASKIIFEGANFNKSWYAHPELAFKAGAKWQKEQMIKDALDAEIINWESMFTSIKVMEPEKAEAMIKEKFDIGDKVKLIIIKEE